MSKTPPEYFRRVRSFVRRDSRITDGQQQAKDLLWPQFGMNIEDGVTDFLRVFGRDAPRYLEIGFGMGKSLLAVAKAYPEKDFIGVETHKPGIGALMLGIQADELTNLRAFYGDVIDVLEKCVPDASLDGVQIFFPDPWQKRKHIERRLIQAPFIKLVVTKLKTGGTLHLATDWEDYSKHMMKVVSAEEQLTNLAGVNQFAGRSPYRPVLSKFESRAGREGRGVWELQFRKL